MKIGILTFHCAINYGAVLQAYGLQEFLRSLGHEAFIVDYRPDYMVRYYRPFCLSVDCDLSFSQQIRKIVRACMVFPVRLKRNRAFSEFVEKQLHLYKLDLNKKEDKFDAFIFGSDQIWNPLLTHGDRAFIGDFTAARNVRKIAYAASFGNEAYLTEVDIPAFRFVAEHFAAISVREQSLQSFFTKHFKKEVSFALDPVLLVGPSVFERIIAKIEVVSPFLLLFHIKRDEAVFLYAQKLSQKKGLQLIEIVSDQESVKNRNYKQSLSPRKFLGYFKNASYIITSSFHGTAFSILFKKNFNVISSGDCKDERASFLLESIGLKDRMCCIGAEMTDREIDYTQIDKRLQKLRQDSENYLIHSLAEN